MKNPLLWIIVLLLVIVALLLGVVLGWWSAGDSDDPEPTATETTTGPAPTTTSPDPGPEFVARPVSTGGTLPAAQPLTAAALESVGARWVTAIHNGDSYDDAGSFTPGDAILYLISPDGARYELANLDTLGFDDVDLVAWDTLGDKLLLVEDRSEMQVFDMTTGAVTSSWTICGEGASVRGSFFNGAWLVRGSCGGVGFDALYGDDGTVMPSDVVGDDFGDSVVDVGAVQVVTGFESFPDERFERFAPGEAPTFLPVPPGLDCYPIGKGLGATVAATCYTAGGGTAVWEIQLDGSPAEQIMTAAQVEDFRLATVGGDEYMGITGYCADSVYRTIVTESDQPRIGTLYGGTIETSISPPYSHENCHGAVNTWALISGPGPLWWINWDTGEEVELLPGAGDSYPLYVVGATETTALYVQPAAG